LNQHQKKAVDEIYGPVLVLAGPGTGKTQVIALRIANILSKTDTAPHNILCLTFTNSGVKAMRERLVRIMGTDGYKVDIHTFHSFCNEVINYYPERFLLAKRMQQISDLEQIVFLKKAMDQCRLVKLRPAKAPYFFVPYILKAINNLKSEGIGPLEFKKLVEHEKLCAQGASASGGRITNNIVGAGFKPARLGDRPKPDKTKIIDKNVELSRIYKIYQESLHQHGYYDYNDMILFVLDEFKKDKNFLANFQEKYLFMLVDEYQDTNGAQNELIKLLGSHDDLPNIFVVGDDDQSIYRFQGASLENLLYFSDLFKRTKKINLNVNYRSPGNILQASRSLMKNAINTAENQLKIKKDFEVFNKKGGDKIRLVNLPNDDVERYYIAKEIELLRKKKVDFNDVAVFYRDNREADDLMKIFDAFGIPHRLNRGEDVLKDKTINQLVDLMKFLLNTNDDELLFYVLNFDFWNIDAVDVYQIFVESKQKPQKKYIFDWLVKKCNDHHNVETLHATSNVPREFDNENTVSRFINFILKMKKRHSNVVFIDFLEALIRESGLLDYLLLSDKRLDKMSKIKSFYNFWKDINRSRPNLKLKDAIGILDEMKENNLQINATNYDFDGQAVNLMTAHGAKGLEFDYVFICGARDKHWSNKRHVEKLRLVDGVLKKEIYGEDKNEEARRLFYVAMTRTKKRLYITWADSYGTGKDKKETTAAMFISEIDHKYCDYINVGAGSSRLGLEIDVDSMLSKTFIKPKQISINEKKYLQKLLEDFSLSPTGLNKYLKCPRAFLYDNIIRVPKAKTRSLAYGTAIHYALEIFFRTYKKTGKLPKVRKLLDFFQAGLKREVLLDNDFDDLLRKGNNDLMAYYDYYANDWLVPLYNEYNFATGKVLLDKSIPLSGKVDRIELIEDGDGESVRVIDYKTGKPKSRNDVLGKTKNSNGDYWRQLVFYKLLGDLSSRFVYRIRETELDFVEPMPSGKFKKERFKITKEDLDELKKTIKEVWRGISRLEFDGCHDQSKCKDCEYRRLCEN